jgi:4-oxalmesaconate hydratase
MIIDCHGQYTTAPPALGEYRDRQKSELKSDSAHVAEMGSARVATNALVIRL